MSEGAPVNTGAVEWPSMHLAYFAIRRMQTKLPPVGGRRCLPPVIRGRVHRRIQRPGDPLPLLR